MTLLSLPSLLTRGFFSNQSNQHSCRFEGSRLRAAQISGALRNHPVVSEVHRPLWLRRLLETQNLLVADKDLAPAPIKVDRGWR